MHPAQSLWRKQLHVQFEVVEDAHIVQHTSLDDLLTWKSRTSSVHRAPTFGTEIGCDDIATIGSLGDRFEVADCPPSFVGDKNIYRVGAAGVLLAFATVTESLAVMLVDC
jgi:hypothetical protein